MRYRFTKMQSLGNDFVVLDGVRESLGVTAAIARRLADRHFGVGCDQVLLVERADAAFHLTIYNPDGSESEQCGNGARCVARFLHQHELGGEVIALRTTTQAMTATLNADETVTVEMGVPEFCPAKIPFIAPQAAPFYMLKLGDGGGDGGADVGADSSDAGIDREVEISALAIGNPHAVRRVPDIRHAPLATDGPLTEHHPRFPARANAGFMQIRSRQQIALRVHERGVGETLGCGSGACAAVAAGINLGLLDQQVSVSLPGGKAQVHWRGPGQPIYLTGSACTVFSGVIDL